MTLRILLTTIWALLQVPAHAHDVCFMIETHASDNANLMSGKYLRVNGRDVSFVPVTTQRGYSKNRGCVDASTIVSGANSFVLAVDVAGGGTAQSLRRNILSIETSSGLKHLKEVTIGVGQKQGIAQFSAALDLEKIAPVVARRVAMEELNRRSAEIRAERLKIEANVRENAARETVRSQRTIAEHAERANRVLKESPDVEFEKRNAETSRQVKERLAQIKAERAAERAKQLEEAQRAKEAEDRGIMDRVRDKVVETLCFVAGTRVRTATGHARIETLRPGDLVVSCDFSGEQCVYAPVVRRMESETMRIARLQIAGQIIGLTPNHPVYLPAVGEFVPVGDLKIGEAIATLGGDALSIEGLEVEELPEPVRVYNLEIAGTHNYYVSSATGAPQDILVHNCGEHDCAGVLNTAGEMFENLALGSTAACAGAVAGCAGGMVTPLGQVVAVPACPALIGGTCGLAGASAGAAVGADALSGVMKMEGEGGGGTSKTDKGSPQSRTTQVDEGKFDYLFGNAKGAKNADHNLARTNQNAAQMQRLGVDDSPAGRKILQEHFDTVVKSETNVAKTFTNEFGSFEVRESLFSGPSGKFAKFETTWEIMADGTRRLTTVIPKGK